MSGKLLELIIFAGVAFFIINKLIAVLGKTSEDDPAKNNNGFFGENLKDVTPEASKYTKSAKIFKGKFLKTNISELKGLVVTKNYKDIETALKEVLLKMPQFNVTKFLNGAKIAFNMIISALKQENLEQLEELVDKRYLDQFKTKAKNYRNSEKGDSVKLAQISEIYIFGNNVFIKVLFSSKNIVKNIKEEWTFSKSAISSDSTWYLNNVEEIASS